jgi:hypothetical protein
LEETTTVVMQGAPDAEKALVAERRATYTVGQTSEKRAQKKARRKAGL